MSSIADHESNLRRQFELCAWKRRRDFEELEEIDVARQLTATNEPVGRARGTVLENIRSHSDYRSFDFTGILQQTGLSIDEKGDVDEHIEKPSIVSMDVSRDPFKVFQTDLVESRFVHETSSFDFQRTVLNDVERHFDRLMFTRRWIVRRHG